MAEKSTFFNSVNGDRKYKAEDMASHFAKVLTNGVMPAGTQLQVIENSGMNVAVSAGSAWINGYAYHNDASFVLVIDPADGALNRVDRIVVRWNKLARSINLTVLKGTPASSAVAPDIIRNADYYDLSIATINVDKGITAITQALITDTRMDSNICGFVSSLIQPDTSGWFVQFETAFNEWFDSVKDVLGSDVAGQLQNQINQLKALENELPDDVATALGLDPADDPQVKDGFDLLANFYRYWWRRYNVFYAGDTGNPYVKELFLTKDPAEVVTFYYSSEIILSENLVTLKSPSVVTVSYDTRANANVLKGKYWAATQSGVSVNYSTATSAITNTNAMGFYKLEISETSAVKSNLVIGTPSSLVFSESIGTYPKNGLQNGYWYVYIGVPFENARAASKFEIGTYEGTGTFGADNPNSITASFPIKCLILMPKDSSWLMGIQGFTNMSGYQPFGTNYIDDNSVAKNETNDGNTWSWYGESANQQMNSSNSTYGYIIFG